MSAIQVVSLMYELIYYSIAAENIDEDTIAKILSVSRDFNAQNSITGCLLFHNNQFLQLLEGEKETVKKLYLKIQNDKRHYNVMVMAEGEKQKRDFDSWHMAFHEMSSSEINLLEKQLFINNFSQLSHLVERASEAVRLFWYMSTTILNEPSN